VLTLARSHGPVSAPRFAHGAHATIPDPRGGGGEAQLFASYHVSQQNTQTGRLTAVMFDTVVAAAKRDARL
jgi:uracil-DNA glycosylase